MALGLLIFVLVWESIGEVICYSNTAQELQRRILESVV